jgi:hypothetical protein
MSKRPTREQWEQDIRDVQRSVLPHEEIRQLQIFARYSAPGTAVFKTARQVRDLLFGLLLLGLGVVSTVGSVSMWDYYLALATIGIVAAILLCVIASLLVFASFDSPPRKR